MLDVDRLAEVMLAGTKAMIAKELAPVRAENETLRSVNLALIERVAALEAREIPTAFDPTEILEAIKAIDVPELPELPEMPDVAALVKAAVDAIPAPQDGISVVEVKQNADGELIVKMTNGETINAGVVRGRDGMGFDDLSVDHDGERLVTIKLHRGDVVKTASLTLPAIIDRGVWTDREFEKGDAVTWAGSLWLAQEATTEKPGAGKGWRLAVKKGRDAAPLVKP